uniref:Uncharacterized protein n=1 Tax=Lepeophtheirus salmonis TaxID=72036 RepID=A0A0K2UYD6_LEPSM
MIKRAQTQSLHTRYIL